MSATQGEKGVLHTKSSYFNAAASYAEGGAARAEMFSNEAITSDLWRALEYAENQEMIFYNQFFPSSSYEDFMNQIREMFAGAHGDGERIRSLANPNLSKWIPENWNQKNAGQITIIIDKTFEGIELPLHLLESDNISVDKDKMVVNVTKSSIQNLKKFFAIAVGRGGGQAPGSKSYFSVGRGKKGLKEGKFDVRLTTWEESSKNKKAFSNWILNEVLIKENGIYKNNFLSRIGINFEITEGNGRLTIEDLDKEIVPFTQYTKTGTDFSGSIKDAIKDPETKAVLETTLEKVYDFIMNDCLQVDNGYNYPDKGNVLKRAATYAWNSVEEKILSGIEGFWFEGKNLSKGVLGAGGEFQVKLINAYVSLVTGNGALGTIIGGIVKDNRAEPRTDVQIIKELGGDMGAYIAGIQVKNVNEDTQTHLSISSDLELIAPNLSEDFRDAMANSMFNTNIKSIVGDAEALLQKYVTVYFWRAMNLNVTDDLNPNHTNTFYFVGGEDLVPASRIISEMVNRQSMGISEPKFTITGFQNPSKGDTDYAERRKKDRKPAFVDYWDPVRYLGFGKGAELEVNTASISLYNSLLAGVSVNTEFNISAIIASMNNIESFTNIFSK